MIKEDIPKKLLMNLSSDNDQPTGKTYHHLLGYIIKNTSKKEVNHFLMKRLTFNIPRPQRPENRL